MDSWAEAIEGGYTFKLVSHTYQGMHEGFSIRSLNQVEMVWASKLRVASRTMCDSTMKLAPRRNDVMKELGPSNAQTKYWMFLPLGIFGL